MIIALGLLLAIFNLRKTGYMLCKTYINLALILKGKWLDPLTFKQELQIERLNEFFGMYPKGPESFV